MESSKLTPKESWDQHVEKLSSMASRTEMAPLRINAKEFWDQHIERLQSFDSEREATVDYLESVEEKRSSPRIRSLEIRQKVGDRILRFHESEGGSVHIFMTITIAIESLVFTGGIPGWVIQPVPMPQE